MRRETGCSPPGSAKAPAMYWSPSDSTGTSSGEPQIRQVVRVVRLVRGTKGGQCRGVRCGAQSSAPDVAASPMPSRRGLAAAFLSCPPAPREDRRPARTRGAATCAERRAAGRGRSDTAAYNGRPVTADPRHPLIPPRKVDAQQRLPALEEQVLERWRERDVFARSLQMRAQAPSRGSSTRAPRRRTAARAPTTCCRGSSRTSTRATRRCAGYRVERKGGWDCHGLPVEIAVEQKLGIASKREIEDVIGIEQFNAGAASRCSSTWRSGTG